MNHLVYVKSSKGFSLSKSLEISSIFPVRGLSCQLQMFSRRMERSWLSHVTTVERLVTRPCTVTKCLQK